MDTKIILLTHENLGSALTDTASKTCSSALDFISTIPVYNYDNPEHVYIDLDNLISETRPNYSFHLILTDLFGATPCNIATRLLDRYPDNTISLVTGLNLPMLLKVINYKDHDLQTLTKKAVSGGKEGITHCCK